MPLKITLHDGSEHTAQYTTLTSILPLIKPLFEEVTDFSNFGQMDSSVIFTKLYQNLGSADFIKDLANGLLTVFPTLSPLVWFNDATRSVPHGVAGLEVTEIFMAITQSLECVNQSGTLTPEKIAAYAALMNTEEPEVTAPQSPKAFMPSKKGKKRH